MKYVVRTITALAMVAGVLSITTVASATPPDPLHRVTICHRTNSVTNPYVAITVDEAAVNMDTGDDNGQGDHNAEHNGPVFDVTADPDVAYPPPHNGDQWGDIIPPFYSDLTTLGDWPSKNWDQAGQDIFNAGCKIPNEPETTFLFVTKTIPNVLNDEETVSIKLTLFYAEGDEILGAVAIDDNPCTLNFSAGETAKDCTFLHLTPGAEYVLVETENGGFTPFEPFFFTGGDDTGTTVTVDNTFGPASAEACKITDSNGTGYDATGDTFKFDLVFVKDPSLRYVDGVGAPLYETGDVIETVTVTHDPQAETNCTPFNTVLEDNVTYDIVEQSAGSAWTTTGGIDEFTPQYPGDADNVYSATFTNTLKPAKAKVCKTATATNAYGFDPLAVDFTFHLKGSDESDVSHTMKGGPAGTPTCYTFDVTLQDGVTYTITEDAVDKWTMGTGTGDCNFTVEYTRDADKTFTCSFVNNRAFSAPLTPGYWKNHLTQMLPLLPQTLGNNSVTTTAAATSIYNVMNCNNVSTNTQNAIGCLAGHLLSTKLNIANGSDGTCIAATVAAADAFLKAIPKSPSGTIAYSGPSGNYSSISTAGRATAITLKSALDKYNNALGC